MVASLRGGARTLSVPVIPGDPNLPRDAPLGVVVYGVWVPVLKSPVQGRPTIVGGLPPPLLRGQPPPSPRRLNACPSLSMIPIFPLLCACLRGDGAGISAASTLSHAPSSPPPPSPPELSVQFVDIRSFFFPRRCRGRNLNASYLVPPIPPPRNKKMALSVALHAPFEQTDKADLL